MADTASVYAAITKADKQPDGTLLVRGVATDSTLDIDEQVCDPAWLKQAMPEWFRWGNIREQHSSIAAGVAEEYEEKDGAHAIVARVVDPNSVKKVETGVLKGFSIGIRRPRIAADKTAAGGRIVGGQIVEVSLVDRPANPACTLTLAKAARPGMTVKSVDLAGDEEHGFLVRVEEYAEKDATTEPAADAPAQPADEPAADSGAPDAPAPDVAGEGDAAGEGAGAPATTDGDDDTDDTGGADADGGDADGDATTDPAAADPDAASGPVDAPADDAAGQDAPADAESAQDADKAAGDGTADDALDMGAGVDATQAADAATGSAATADPKVLQDGEAAHLATGKTVVVGEHGPELDVAAAFKAAAEASIQRHVGEVADAKTLAAVMGEALADVLGKRAFTAEQRRDAADSGAAMPDGSFPIKTTADLENAIRAVGRAKDPEAAKAHIKERAKALGKESLIPDSWKAATADATAGKADPVEGLALLTKWAGRINRLDLLPDVSKAAGTHDPNLLAAVRNGILACIVAEAQEAMTGEREEWDISALLNSLKAFLGWWDNEAYHDEVPFSQAVPGAGADATQPASPGTVGLDGLDGIPADTDMGGGVVEAAASGATVVKFLAADAEKSTGTSCGCCDSCTAGKAASTDTETPAPAGAGENAATDTVKAPAAESVNAHLLDVIEGLTERLERVEKAAAPGGPVRVRPTAAERVSRQGDTLRAEVARLRALAKSAGDRGIAAEYDRRADEAETALKALTATPAATA